MLDLARAIRDDRPERASGAIAAHALDVLLATASAAEMGTVVEISSRVERPEPPSATWDPTAFTL
ncbi:MAG: hypothetical protein ABWX56_00820 [Mycetocola sp.]